jgi:hypothetical protein
MQVSKPVNAFIKRREQAKISSKKAVNSQKKEENKQQTDISVFINIFHRR